MCISLVLRLCATPACLLVAALAAMCGMLFTCLPAYQLTTCPLPLLLLSTFHGYCRTPWRWNGSTPRAVPWTQGRAFSCINQESHPWRSPLAEK
jgi:hypothetical protein